LALWPGPRTGGTRNVCPEGPSRLSAGRVPRARWTPAERLAKPGRIASHRYHRRALPHRSGFGRLQDEPLSFSASHPSTARHLAVASKWFRNPSFVAGLSAFVSDETGRYCAWTRDPGSYLGCPKQRLLLLRLWVFHPLARAYVSRPQARRLSPTGLSPPAAGRSRPLRLDGGLFTWRGATGLPWPTHQPRCRNGRRLGTAAVWAAPGSFATTTGILSSPRGTEMFQFPRCPPAGYVFPRR
jgi:hypothetical protein